MPEPSWMRFRFHETLHLVELTAQSTTHLKLIRAPDFHLDLLGIQDRQHRMIHRLQLRLFFSRMANLTREPYNGLPFSFLRVQKGTLCSRLLAPRCDGHWFSLMGTATF